jgi:septum formation protein
VRLYLASTSPARLAILRAAGIEPIVLPSGVDEPAVIASRERGRSPLSAAEVVLELAQAKARAVVGTLVDGEPIDGFVLGADSAFEIDGQIHGKPHLAEVARSRWRQQRGRAGVLWSGHCLIDHRGGRPAGTATGVDSATVRFEADIDDDEIDAYLATGEPLNVAGAFTIDGRGAAFIAEVSGTPSAVIGLSIPLLRRLLSREFGVRWPSLWNR